ncbi:hypothetical protein HMPREF1860_01882 [Prevotella amnii]|uniref:PD-(D/E)XK endonuclease-like domain-containing protein n=1 Tax=Prevotella amnii TaxID=419005 RepID=A0A134B5C1_9BACT|nr:hypothetical protein [Prevotella amnii]KXB75139.1 hypothetical protein HMPREF1860_01882 [Prevotella amnii]
MERLNESPVIFDNGAHTYTLNGMRLSGVTAIVKWMFPETYKDIPLSVLEKAAAHGTQVHTKCEMYDSLGIGDDIPEVQDYIRLKEQEGLATLVSEYLVDDGAHIASSIDKVFNVDGNGCYPLGDLKTTSKIHKDNVTLQLSIYAYLFEKNNEGKKAGRLMCIWLPKEQYGDAAVINLKRIPSDACKEIIAAYLAKEDPTPYREKWFGTTESAEVALIEEELPANLKDSEEEIIRIEMAIKELEKKKGELKSGLYDLMIKHNVKKWQSQRLQLIRKLDSTKETLDSAKVKKKYPEIYQECKKVSAVKGSLTIKVL